jgi:phytoene dehydrogenase-like protein
MFEFVFKMFTLGVAALPARGIGAVAQQLADALPQGTVELRTAAVGVTPTSVTVRDVGAGGALGAAARTVESDAVVIAVERPALPLIDGAADAVATDGGRASVALYFAFRGPPPIAEPILVLNGQAGPALAKSSTNGPFVNNVCFPSQVAPSYAPAGQSLASVTVIGNPDVDDATLEAAVRAELGGWFGRECVSEWRHLRTYRVPYAQPAQTGASGTFTRPARLANGLYRCGDHTSSPTLNGAMESGRLAAEAVLADLRR